MQQINALQRKLTHTSSAVKTQSGIDMLSVKQKLSSSKKRPQIFEEDTQIKPFKHQERDRETLQRELNAIDDQTRQFKNQYNSYKSGYKVSGSSQPMMMYNDSDNEEEEDRKIIEQHMRQQDRRKMQLLEKAQAQRESGQREDVRRANPGYVGLEKSKKQNIDLFQELDAKRDVENYKEDVDDGEYG